MRGTGRRTLQTNLKQDVALPLRRRVVVALVAGFTLAALGASLSQAEWNDADQTAAKVEPAGFVRHATNTPQPVRTSTFVPKWVSAPNAVQQASGDDESEVKQAAYTQPNTRLSSLADPLPDVPTPAEAPETISPGPEMVSPTTEASGDDVMILDDYDAYQPGLTNHVPNYSPAPNGGNCSGGQGCGCDSCWGPGDVYGNSCGPCRGPALNRLWVRADALIWWVEGFRVPALVTSSEADPLEPFLAGALGDDDTTILFGNSRMNSESYSGGRISFGHWLDPCETLGIEASYFALDQEVTRFRAESDGDPLLARPFFDIGGLGAAAWPIALEDFVEGSVAVDATTELTGVEVLFRRALMQGCGSRLDLLAGYRYAQLDDSLRISQSSIALEDAELVPVDSTLDLYDQFTTRNEFHGAEIGISSYTRRCRWTFETLLKLAFGSTRSYVDIRGESDYSEGGLLDSGFLAQSTNSGRHSQREFTMIPELGVTVGYDVTCNLRFTFGYSLIYWSKVARPGEQIDMDLDLVRSGVIDTLPDVPPVATGDAIHPQFRMNTTDIWAQGMNLGLSYRF